ncbi:S8 family serine peptidase [Thalassotalea psychrophila]|uniref:S8 family serine peptidase n=1 Tax=Thalassotalea psychrophila TaxID=3065647 RepID=A0ABY9U228_9GAMM|nr:S8 family serine peptidase [Colwelliaceae bacterium SQ149]
MIFQKSTLAICAVGLLVASVNSASANTANLATTIGQQNESEFIAIYEQVGSGSHTYLITLSNDGALAQAMQNQNISREQASLNINTEQQQLIDDISLLDQNAVVGRRFRIVGNMLYVKMAEAAAKQLQQNSLVTSINVVDASDAEFIEAEQSPYTKLKVNDDGGHTVVALIGSGVDYTHASLGGEGTVADFSKGYANATNYWGGFPNDVVIGGFDLSSEEGLYDYNPIEYPVDYTPPYASWQHYTGGIGTMAASLVRQAASDAKILAYKTSGISFRNYVRYESRGNFALALEMAMDPNQDGDMSDSADILLIDYANSISAYYQELETGGSHYPTQMGLIRAVAATGSLVVVPAGDDDHYKYHNYYSLSYRGGVKEALTVGYSEHEADNYTVADNSPLGPTRGESILKPDILALKRDVTGAAAATGSGFHKITATPYLIAAKVAGTAASIMESNPELTNSEVKALIVNTGILDIEQHWGVAQIGGGSLNPLAAMKSYALMMDQTTLLPSINLGQQSVFNKSGFSRNIIVKNLTDKSQTYRAEIIINGDTPNNQAIDVVLPEYIVLAPNEVKTIAVAFNIDADKLAPPPITEGKDFSLENWDKLAINGFIQLNHERNPGASIHMPWMIMPQLASSFVVDAESVDYTPIYNDEYYLDKDKERPVVPHSSDWVDKATYPIRWAHHEAELSNNSAMEQDLYAMTLFYNAENKPVGREDNHGRYIKSLAGGIFPQEQCSSGKQMSLAVRMFEKMDLPMANHFDRLGSTLLYVKMYNQKSVELADGSNELLEKSLREKGMLTSLAIGFDQNGAFRSTYRDLSMEQDRSKPLARLKDTGLPLIISPGGDSLIINICTDKMYHGEINHTTFEQPIALQFSTDRQSLPGVDDPIMQHNFSTNGEIIDVIVEDENADEDADNCRDGYITDNVGNCIRTFTSPITMSIIDYFYDGYYYDVNEQAKFERRDYDYACAEAEFGNKSCQLTHPRFNKVLTFTMPETIEFNNDIDCTFAANETLASCFPAELSASDNIDVTAFITEVDFSDLLQEPELLAGAAYSFHTGSVIKIANQTESESLIWKNHIVVPANGKVRVSYLSDNVCQSLFKVEECLPGAVVFSPKTSYFAIADGTAEVLNIQTGQSFIVPENAQNGQIIGYVQRESNNITKLQNQRLFLVDGDEGAPFQLSEQGVLSVRDATQLDFERSKSYRLVVAANWGKVWGKSLPITVGVANVNDNAPQQLTSIAHIQAQQQQPLNTVDLSQNFTDDDNQGMIFIANNLPLGLTMDKAGRLSGTPAKHGEFSATIIVSDGATQLSAEINFEIAKANDSGQPEEQQSSAGAMHFGIFMLLMTLRRRYR